jgi:hypothetical protein
MKYLPPRLAAFFSPPDACLHGLSTERLRLPLCVDCARDNRSASNSRSKHRANRYNVRGIDSCPTTKFRSRKQLPTPPIWSSKSPSRIAVVFIAGRSRHVYVNSIELDANSVAASRSRRYVPRTHRPATSEHAGRNGREDANCAIRSVVSWTTRRTSVTCPSLPTVSTWTPLGSSRE